MRQGLVRPSVLLATPSAGVGAREPPQWDVMRLCKRRPGSDQALSLSLQEESHDLSRCVGSVGIGERPSVAATKPSVRPPVHQPVLSHHGTTWPGVVRHGARFATLACCLGAGAEQRMRVFFCRHRGGYHSCTVGRNDRTIGVSVKNNDRRWTQRV
jgi:hypothetical protein